MSSIEQTILNVFRHDGVLCGKNDVYVGNGIPAAKARNLAAACNAGLNPGFLVVVDCTVFGSCKNGMGISAQGIYTHNDWAADCKSGFVSWDELVRDGRIRKGSSFEILFVRSRTIGINLSGSDVKQDELLPFLETLRDAVENLYKTAAPAATPDGYFPERDAEPSPAEMAKQCRALALEGDAEAQYLLGTMYENGLGVRFNDEEAKKWYRKAAAQGYADARRALRRMG